MIGSFSESPRNVRRTVVRAIGSASSDRRHDGEVVAVHELRLQSRPEANILVVPVDVDELAELPLVVVEAFLESRKLQVQLVQGLRHVAGIDLDNGRAASQLPKGAGDTDLDRHVVVIISREGALALELSPWGEPAPYPPPLAGEGRVGALITPLERPGPS